MAEGLAAFELTRLPRILFGRGTFAQIGAQAARFGRRLLLVTGARALQAGPYWAPLLADCGRAGLEWELVTVDGEPTPEMVDTAVRRYAAGGIDVVVGIGGGSALDAAKAIAGLLRSGDSVMDYLEGVGPERPYQGPAVPLIAVPTTAGTGSEATKNAVLSRQGPDGFKKSFRDAQLIARVAIVDPALLASCPPAVIAANGMDALTQLLESYVSLRANPMTDALALSGLAHARDALIPFYEGGAGAHAAQDGMAYAALLSGITLAQVGLGSVHGLASPLGAFFPIPHGVVCGTLVAAATAVNLEALATRDPGHIAGAKYAHAAEVLCGQGFEAPTAAHRALVDLLEHWTETLALPRLGEYRVGLADLPRIVAHARGSSMRTNPLVLTDEEISSILRRRL